MVRMLYYPVFGLCHAVHVSCRAFETTLLTLIDKHVRYRSRYHIQSVGTKLGHGVGRVAF